MTSLIHPRLECLYRYWLSIKKNRQMPTKTDLDLRQIPSYLPSVFLIEWDPVDMVFRWRLTGTSLYTLWGRELSTSPVLDLWGPGQRHEVASTLQRARTAFQPFCMRLRGLNDVTHDLRLEMLTVPLLDTSSTNILIFGGLVSCTLPFWLEHHHLQSLSTWETVALNSFDPDLQNIPKVSLAPVSIPQMHEAKNHQEQKSHVGYKSN